jgi:hypothetical protein
MCLWPLPIQGELTPSTRPLLNNSIVSAVQQEIAGTFGEPLWRLVFG